MRKLIFYTFAKIKLKKTVVKKKLGGAGGT